jgi:hypothetical protein
MKRNTTPFRFTPPKSVRKGGPPSVALQLLYAATDGLHCFAVQFGTLPLLCPEHTLRKRIALKHRKPARSVDRWPFAPLDDRTQHTARLPCCDRRLPTHPTSWPDPPLHMQHLLLLNGPPPPAEVWYLARSSLRIQAVPASKCAPAPRPTPAPNAQTNPLLHPCCAP